MPMLFLFLKNTRPTYTLNHNNKLLVKLKQLKYLYYKLQMVFNFLYKFKKQV